MYPILISLAVAAQVWGSPTCGQPVVAWQDLGDDLTYGRTWEGQCIIALNTRRRASFRYKELLCTVIVHEVGHLTGHKHSADPDNVMYPVDTRPYWRCIRAFAPKRKRVRNG